MSYERSQPLGKRPPAGTDRGPRRGRKARRIYFESLVLEDRTLLASLSTVLNAYDSATAGISVLNQLGAAAIVNQALNAVNVPFVNQSLAGLSQLGLAGKVRPSLVTINSLLAKLPRAPTDNNATWTQVQTALTDAGFSIEVPWTGQPTSEPLLEVSYTATPNAIPPLSINVDQNTPFPYLNDGLFANFSATAQITVPYTITLGVDIPSGQTEPMFFVLQNADALSASLVSSIAANTIDADLDIGDLANVTAANSTAQQVLNVTGSLGFYSNPSSDPLDAGGKLRASDFTKSLSTAVQGNLNGRRSCAQLHDAVRRPAGDPMVGHVQRGDPELRFAATDHELAGAVGVIAAQLPGRIAVLTGR